MNCELAYCIYNRDFLCTLKETQLNSLGMCEECIVVSIPDDILKELKEKQLEEIENRWADNHVGARIARTVSKQNGLL